MYLFSKKVKILIILLLFNVTYFIGQSDSTQISELTIQSDGLYFSHADFRANKGISKEVIETNLNKEQIDIYTKLTTNEIINYNSSATSHTIESKNIWGYMQNKTLFINYRGLFYRVPVFGAISYFAAVIEVTGYYNGVYDPMFGGAGGRSVKTQEIHEFIMNYYDGKVLDYYMEDLEKILKKDDEIYKNFKKLSRRNRKKQVSRYIRMYNEKHPIYYLKN